METVVLIVAALACPVGMGVMMLVMAKGMGMGKRQEGSRERLHDDQ